MHVSILISEVNVNWYDWIDLWRQSITHTLVFIKEPDESKNEFIYRIISKCKPLKKSGIHILNITMVTDLADGSALPDHWEQSLERINSHISESVIPVDVLSIEEFRAACELAKTVETLNTISSHPAINDVAMEKLVSSE